VASLRREYHVLEGATHYIVLSPSRAGTGNYSVVPKSSVEYLLARVGGRRGISSTEIFDRCKRSSRFRDRFAVLNALYVLVALGAATIAKFARPLVFNVRKRVVS